MLEARSLTKFYNQVRAVHEISFSIKPGEILGYLGHNGAGKSTTIRMLTGLIEPSEGQILYKGRSIYEDLSDFQRRLGYVPEEAYLYPHLSGREYLQLVGRLRGMSRTILDPKMDELLRLLDLWDDRFTAMSSYSKGMRQKILLSAALLHNPEVLILDEPFSGLDVTSALMLRRLLDGLALRGKILLYSSHVLEVVEKVCSKVLILRQGEVVAYDSINKLRELMRQPSLEGVFAQLTQTEDGSDVADRILEVVSSSDEEHRRFATMVSSNAVSETKIFPTLPGDAVESQRQRISNKTVAPSDRPFDEKPTASRWVFTSPARYFAHLGKDLKHGLRMLASSPGFTAVALLSLSMGICIATCAFSEMNGITLRRLPAVEKPDELVALQLPTSYPNYRRYSSQDDLFSSAAAYVAPVPFDLSLSGNKERSWGQLITTSYFSTLGVRPELGRLFDVEDERSSGTAPVVISYRFWQQHFGSDASVIGKTLRINSQNSTIIGVGPKDFLGASPLLFAADLWLPMSVGEHVAPELGDNALERRDRSMFRMVARLKQGATITRAENELDTITRQLAEENGDFDLRTQRARSTLLVEGGKLLPLREQDLPFFTSFLSVLAGLIMLIACANVANMTLARAANRQKEIAIRMAIGASRGRIIRQLLTESSILAVGAAIPGFLACMWLMHLLSRMRMPLLIPVTFDFHPDGRVLLLTVALTATTGLVFGLVPALQATNTNLTRGLRGGINIRFRRLRYLTPRNALLVSQFVGSLTLLVMLAVLSLGIQSRLGMHEGFSPVNLYLISIDPIRDGYSPEQTAVFFDKVLDRIKAMPGISAATLTETVPVSLSDGNVQVNTSPAGGHPMLNAIKHVVGADYFVTAGIPILMGRTFRKEDEISKTTAVMVNAELVQEFWNGQDPLGRQLQLGEDQVVPAKILPGSYDYRVGISGKSRELFEVVGVVNNVPEGLIEHKPSPALYFPLRKDEFSQPPAGGFTLMVRGSPGIDVIGNVRRELSVIDPNITLFNARSMPEQIDQFMASLRIASWTYGLIGVFGLLLSSIGLAGMTAYCVVQRRREIAIRRALGAPTSSVLGLVMKEGVLVIAIGIMIGLVGEWAVARMLAAMNASVGQVTATSASNPVVLVGAPLLLSFLALLACYLPARKSTRIDPVVALREE